MQKGKFSSLSWREKCSMFFVYLDFINKYGKRKWSILTWSKWKKLFLSHLQIAEKNTQNSVWCEVKGNFQFVENLFLLGVQFHSVTPHLDLNSSHRGICEMPSFALKWNISSLLYSSGWKMHPVCQIELALHYSFINSLYILYQTVAWILFLPYFS